jgi:hypothetical protein
MKYKLVSIVLLLFLLIVSVSARECLDRVKPGENCTIITPAGMDCTQTYDIINATGFKGTAIVDNRALNTLNSTVGLCYTSFNQSTGDYVVVFNEDNSSRRIVVDSYTNENLMTEVDNVEENQATMVSYIGDPSGNSTNIWTYIYGDLDSGTNHLLYRIWRYAWRTISGVET